MITEADLKRLEWKAPDYTDLKEKEFLQILKEITTLEELESVANRKRHLNAPQLQSWNDWQRAAIINRKLELEDERG